MISVETESVYSESRDAKFYNANKGRVPWLAICDIFNQDYQPRGLNACFSIGLGGAALAPSAHRVVFLYLVALLHLPSFFRFVVQVK